MISDKLGPGKIDKLPKEEAITMNAFRVQYVLYSEIE